MNGRSREDGLDRNELARWNDDDGEVWVGGGLRWARFLIFGICGGGDDGIFGGKMVWTPTMHCEAVEGKTIPSFRHPYRYNSFHQTDLKCRYRPVKN